MNIYEDYIKEIEERKVQGLEPKPIDNRELLFEIITEIKDLLLAPDIYIPILGFIFLILMTVFLKKIFYKK